MQITQKWWKVVVKFSKKTVELPFLDDRVKDDNY